MNQMNEDVRFALNEDIGTGDVTAQLIPLSTVGTAIIKSREPAIVCGQAWVNSVFQQVSPEIEVQWLVAEGSLQEEPGVWVKLKGPLRHILTAERTALNFLQTLSAVATKTYRYVQCIQHTSTVIMDTRKTIPGLRKAEKYAVVCGGGKNHRMGLYDEFLIKENHIQAMGSITAAIQAAREVGCGKPIVVEVQNIQEFLEAKSLNPTRIMLDNFSDDMIREVIALNQINKVTIEVSGGITEKRIQALAEIGVDCISVGDLTKSVTAIDLSLLIISHE